MKKKASKTEEVKPLRKLTKATKPLVYELWMRIQCVEKECGGWTGMTLRDRPDKIRCVLCDAVLEIGRVDEDGFAFEYRRRGPWTRPLLSPQEKDKLKKEAEEKADEEEEKAKEQGESAPEEVEED